MTHNKYLSELIGQDLNLDAKGGRKFYPALVQDTWMLKDGTFHAACVEVESDGYNGWNFGFTIPDGVKVRKGDVVLVGIDGFNHVGFIYVNGQVVRNYSTQDYENERQRMLEQWAQEKRRILEENREVWTARESYLSDQARSRIGYFRANAEGDFDVEAWGYELVIAELTDMLVASNLEETDEIKTSDAYSQCSGNQFSLAKALARAILDGQDISGTVAGLAPLTGKVHY